MQKYNFFLEKDYICVMSGFKKYTFNQETLSYEFTERSKRTRLFKSLFLLFMSFVMAAVYFWIYSSVLGLDAPKTAILKKINADWCSKIEIMNRQLDKYDEELSSFQMRDNDIYRSVFGMNEIPAEVRNAGFGGVNRYSWLEGEDYSNLLRGTYIRIDVLTKKSYVQTKSFDEVALFSKRAGDMASCVPAVPPIMPDRSEYRISSSYGYRKDPISGRSAFHEGMDFALSPGHPVYVTGDGTVDKVVFGLFGYGNYIVVDHGFGYKTRYAHLSGVNVAEGQKVKRGEQIGASGNTGKSSGPHLHYEVIYRGRPINPYNYLDLAMSVDEYRKMVDQYGNSGSGSFLHQSHRRK